jgi:hypothetical protein
VLGGEPAATALRRFFPTAGGQEPPTSPDFEPALHQEILARRETLARFIREAQVQTNETGRGLCWLLPVSLARWPQVRLVDLGASAGLNLVAEKRAYRLVDASSDTPLLDVGQGEPVQFQTRCLGWTPDFSAVDGRAVPRVLGRDGSDLAPFRLDDRGSELTLMSFVWGDQRERMARLLEGIAALHGVNQSDAPVRLAQADLPDDLGRFLHEALAQSDRDTPVVIYNTWMATYLRDKGQSLGYHIDHWAAKQQRPVLWLQWEPARDGSEPPHPGWCLWTAESWRGQERKRWRLGWVHPHGGEAELDRELDDWRRYWED